MSFGGALTVQVRESLAGALSYIAFAVRNGKGGKGAHMSRGIEINYHWRLQCQYPGIRPRCRIAARKTLSERCGMHVSAKIDR